MEAAGHSVFLLLRKDAAASLLIASRSVFLSFFQNTPLNCR
jgi:hypothetical protein